MGETETEVSGELIVKKPKKRLLESKSKLPWVGQLILCYVLLFVAFKVFAQQAEVDHLALVRVLVKDGYYDRAERTLRKLSADEKQDNSALIASFWGMIELNKKNYEKSLDQFNRSLKLGIESKEIYLYRAESFLQLERLQEAEVSLENIGIKMKTKLPYFLVKAEIHWKQDRKVEAWRVLDEATTKGLSSTVINKKKFSYLLSEHLFLAAKDIAFKTLKDENAFQDVLAMASQFRIAKQHQTALELLQALQVLRPEKEMVALEMAQNYLALEERFSAALILEKAAKHNISLSFEASEMLRQVGKSYRARFLNMTTMDPAKRLKQKLALYLEDDDYLSLKFLVPQLQKNQLLEDQDIRYAVAYSLFRTGDFEKSEVYLNSIDKDGLFEKSIELKREISNCKQEKWACSETI